MTADLGTFVRDNRLGLFLGAVILIGGLATAAATVIAYLMGVGAGSTLIMAIGAVPIVIFGAAFLLALRADHAGGER